MNHRLNIAFVSGLLLAGAGIWFLSFAGVDELVEPVRIDSLYIEVQKADYMRTHESGPINPAAGFYNSPDDLGMCYENMEVTTIDSLRLMGWYIASETPANSTILLILHNQGESRITSLETARHFNDRGYSVCLFDMRAHGTSEGTVATFGYMEKYDVKNIIDSLMAKEPHKHIALLGVGTGAAIAMQAANMDLRIKVIIAQSPFNNLTNFVHTYSFAKWGKLNGILFPYIKKRLEEKLGYKLVEVDLGRLARKITVPVLFITGTSDPVLRSKDTREVYDECIALRKELWTIGNTTNDGLERALAEKYYNKISIYIVNNMPKKIIKTRFRKFV